MVVKEFTYGIVVEIAYGGQTGAPFIGDAAPWHRSHTADSHTVLMGYVGHIAGHPSVG